MNVLLLTVGSRGDIQPYVALGGELVQAGHGVAVCAPEHFRPFIEAHGLAYAHMDEGIMQYIAGDAASEAIGKAGGLTGWIQVARETSAAIKPLYRQVMADAWQAAQTGLDGAAFDAVVYHPKAVAGYHVAEALGVPGILSMPLPGLATTGEFPSIVFPKLGPGWYNRMTYWVANRMGRLSYGGLVNDFRTQTLGLPKWGIGDSELRQVDGSPTPFLHCYSETVSPRPADWPPEWVVSGYWFLDDDDEWEPTAELAAFLDAGAPPVYVGFGSMTGGDPARTTRTVVEGVAMSGQRAVMASGWGGLRAESLPETILPVESVPHGWLFPRVLAVVHHGGAGTTAAGLRAGKPTVICPFFGDQPFWGRRVRALGAGPEPIPQKQLAAEKLAAAIVQAVHDPAMRQNAEQVGWALRGEDGVGNAVQQIEAWAAGG